MPTQSRGERGRFAPKSQENREVRSLRLTNATWEKLGELAASRSITRSDLLEESVQTAGVEQPIAPHLDDQIDQAIAHILEDPSVTRNGKDRESARRALEALRAYLSSPRNTR